MVDRYCNKETDEYKAYNEMYEWDASSYGKEQEKSLNSGKK